MLLRRTQQLLVSVGPPKVPDDLGLKLRLAFRGKLLRRSEGRVRRTAVRMEDVFPRVHGSGDGGAFERADHFGIAMMYFVGTVDAARR